MLTNSSISKEVGFYQLFNIFKNRYQEVKDEIEKLLLRSQLLDLAELYTSYKSKNYNDVILKIKKAGFSINSVKDKETLKHVFENILKPDCSAFEALNLAFENKIIEKSEAHQDFILRKENELDQLKEDSEYQSFKVLFDNGATTFSKMKKENTELYEEVFDEFNILRKKENFYLDVFSDKLSFIEILNYYRYLKGPDTAIGNEKKIEYMTMHMTKGSSIENVMVVADEYFWTQYNFKSVFEKDSVIKTFEKTLKLFYVACSRTKSNLIIVRLILKDEEDTVKQYFENYEEMKLL
jgi:DNA helicase-2/ATP-dependent DNA helicase PcrA